MWEDAFSFEKMDWSPQLSTFSPFLLHSYPVSNSETVSGEAAMVGDAGAVYEVKQFWRGPLESLHSLVSRAVYIWWRDGGVKFVVHLCFHPRFLKTGFLTFWAQIGSSC